MTLPLFETGLTDVADTYGGDVASALRRTIRDEVDPLPLPARAGLVRVGRFTWFEASSESFGVGRYHVERGDVRRLSVGSSTEELRGMTELLARYAPLDPESDDEALFDVVAAFYDAGPELQRDERDIYKGTELIDTVHGPRISDGEFVVDAFTGGADFGTIQRVHVVLATGATRIEAGSNWQTARAADTWGGMAKIDASQEAPSGNSALEEETSEDALSDDTDEG